MVPALAVLLIADTDRLFEIAFQESGIADFISQVSGSLMVKPGDIVAWIILLVIFVGGFLLLERIAESGKLKPNQKSPPNTGGL